MEAIEAFCGKMAYGLRKCVQKFKRTWKESPENAKLPGLAALKKRLRDNNVEVKSEETDSQPASADDTEQLGHALQHGRTLDELPKKDWASLAEKVRARKQGLAKPAESSPSALPPATECAQPLASKKIPTPARSEHMLPEYVVQALKAEAAAPVPAFATGNGKDDTVPTGQLAEETPKEKKKKTVPAKKQNKTKAKTQKKKLVAGPEEEAGLSLLQPPEASVALAVGPCPAEPTSKGTVEEQAADPVYKAGEFNKIRLAWIRQKRAATGMSWKEASDKWMICDERITILGTLPLSQMKKRRF